MRFFLRNIVVADQCIADRGVRLIFRRGFFFIGSLGRIGGAARELAAFGELAVICRSFRLQEEDLIIDSWFACGIGDLPFHPCGVVLKKIHVVKKQRKPGRVDVVSARLLCCGLGLIELADPLIAVGEIYVVIAAGRVDLQACSAAA